MYKNKKTVLITGILGQDAPNMAEYLLSLGQDLIVVGTMRRISNPNYGHIKAIKDNENFFLDYLDLSDQNSIEECFRKYDPDYFINFGANSYVGVSWKMPEQMMDVNAVGVLRCLEIIRKLKPSCRFYSAGSSEEWGNVDYSPQDIKHPLKPRSPYGASKASARHIVKVYRESFNLFAIHGILFNHEGTKRGEEFVTRKISKGVARISSAIRKKQPFKPIELGNLDAKRDWSDSRDFVEGIWLMVNQKDPKEYILSSGETHSIREFVEKSFLVAGIEGVWHGSGSSEELSLPGYLIKEQQAASSVLVKINPNFYRPAEVELLLGDSSPAKAELGWKPKISFDQLVESMTKYDIENTP